MGKSFLGGGLILLFVLGLGFIVYHPGQSQEKAETPVIVNGKEKVVISQPKAAEPSRLVQYIQLLQEEIGELQLGTRVKLPEALKKLSQPSGETGQALPIYIDEEAFREEDPDAPPMNDMEVRLPISVKRMTRAAVLRHLLAQCPTMNATFIVSRDGVKVTTLGAASLPNLLQEKALGNYVDTPLGESLRDLAERNGVSVLVDKRVGEATRTPVTATFTNDMSLHSAFTLLCEMANLKCVIGSDSVFVTTPDTVKTYQKEREDNLSRQIKLYQFQNNASPMGGFGLDGLPFQAPATQNFGPLVPIPPVPGVIPQKWYGGSVFGPQV
jgi:hypothetical protein